MSAKQPARPMAQECLPIRDWMTGPADRSDASAYVHLIRAKDDPEETKKRGAGTKTSLAWKDLLKTPAAEWRRRLLDHLADGKPRTFNRICVELTGHTADVCFDKGPDPVLWQLVADGLVEHTTDAPILFRRKATA